MATYAIGVLTKTSPLAELLSVGHLDQGDLVLGAESDDKLLVGLLLASLVEDAHVGLAAVEGLGSLTETAGKTVVHEGELQDTLEGVKNGHLALGAGIGGNLDLLGHLGGVVLFYVRLYDAQGQWLAKVCPSEVQVVIVVVVIPTEWDEPNWPARTRQFPSTRIIPIEGIRGQPGDVRHSRGAMLGGGFSV